MNWKKRWAQFVGYEPEIAIHNQLVELEKLTSDQIELWGEFQRYLASEREKRLPELLDALTENRQSEIVIENGSRIVETMYATNPLCSVGSVIRPPGGRFNFGPISSFYKTFHALYLASDYQTAFSEKFPPPDNMDSSELQPEQYALAQATSFVHSRVKISLSNVLDLRNANALKGFSEIVCRRETPKKFKEWGEQVGFPDLGTIQNENALFENILAKNYEQWCFLLDQPSNSQWLGHYAKKAGMEGIIYPSVRNTEGFNVAIFPENIEESEVSLRDASALVEEKYMSLHSKNYSLFTQSNDQMNIFTN